MLKGLLAFFGLAVALTVLALLSGYLDYRRDMNTCLDAGGIVIKTSHGLKCVPRGEVKLI